MRIAVGNDHAGYPLKDYIINLLKELNIEVIYFGSNSKSPVDFPDIAEKVCNAVRNKEAERGLMICGTGVGASIAANKFSGIRAAVAHDTYSAHQCVEHDDVNVLCIGAQIIGERLAKEIMATFLKSEFSTEEHFRRRVNKLREIELKTARELQNYIK
ncbi:ribose 5-phosphate isomerase B [Lederbergia panacisoli]|uniref:ribose 5-phosphate isomerase B n=1 Tax=Lederbergia panacisoli TaxID=1255251 RepID=UPI00214CE51C|nr:ribose 5-phosphate isomerase B [Lederbergia panacisoli]MCR2822568.1 ribose 5-phosphate isomerase B [Lederbergia panacisoli]